MLPVLELYWRSTFCPQPLGDAPTRKAIVDALAMGCIPVFLDRSTVREWAWHWGDWIERASVFIPHSAGLINALRKIPMSEIAAKKSVIAENAHRLQYSAVDLNSLRAAAAAGSIVPDTDAFEIALLNAWKLSQDRQRQSRGRSWQARSAAASDNEATVAAACPVRLAKKLSMAPCTLGSSFGCYPGDRSQFWVRSCRGFFFCDPDGQTPAVLCGNRNDAHRQINCSCTANPAGKSLGSDSSTEHLELPDVTHAV